MNLREHIPLAPLTTFRIGGPARYVVSSRNDDEVRECVQFAKTHELPLLVLGEGSNMLIADEGFSGVVLCIENDRVVTTQSEGKEIVIADAGLNWDALVAHTTREGLWGLENLSSIPGTVGASVVQNIGAYGVEISSIVTWVDVYDRESDTVRKLSAAECKFGYRDSIFKSREGKQLIVLRVAYALSKEGTPNMNYKDLIAYDGAVKKIVSLADMRTAVMFIREKKFPHLDVIGTAGSYFKNPVVKKEKADEFLLTYPHAPSFPQLDGQVKLSAAWIIDHVLQVKGERVGDVGSWGAQALVLVNYGHATAYDVASYARVIIEKCFTATGIQLEPEVVYVGAVE